MLVSIYNFCLCLSSLMFVACLSPTAGLLALLCLVGSFTYTVLVLKLFGYALGIIIILISLYRKEFSFALGVVVIPLAMITFFIEDSEGEENTVDDTKVVPLLFATLPVFVAFVLLINHQNQQRYKEIHKQLLQIIEIKKQQDYSQLIKTVDQFYKTVESTQYREYLTDEEKDSLINRAKGIEKMAKAELVKAEQLQAYSQILQAASNNDYSALSKPTHLFLSITKKMGNRDRRAGEVMALYERTFRYWLLDQNDEIKIAQAIKEHEQILEYGKSIKR